MKRILTALVLMAPMCAFAMVHNGSTSLARGVIYHCGGHTVDVFGDEDAPAGLAASIDKQAAIPLMNSIHTDEGMNILFFGVDSGNLHMSISQAESRAAEGGDHAVTIQVVKGQAHGEQTALWKEDVCTAE